MTPKDANVQFGAVVHAALETHSIISRHCLRFHVRIGTFLGRMRLRRPTRPPRFSGGCGSDVWILTCPPSCHLGAVLYKRPAQQNLCLFFHSSISANKIDHEPTSSDRHSHTWSNLVSPQRFGACRSASALGPQMSLGRFFGGGGVNPEVSVSAPDSDLQLERAPGPLFALAPEVGDGFCWAGELCCFAGEPSVGVPGARGHCGASN